MLIYIDNAMKRIAECTQMAIRFLKKLKLEI